MAGPGFNYLNFERPASNLCVEVGLCYEDIHPEVVLLVFAACTVSVGILSVTAQKD